MNELIRITEKDGRQVVSARDLYGKLEVKRDFSTWCKKMFEYGFQEGADFSPVWGRTESGRASVDYAISIDCAKEIAMIQRTDRGKEIRQYFIDVEKKFIAAKETFIQLQSLEPEEILLRQAQMMVEQRKQIKAIQQDVEAIKAITITRQDYVTIAGYSNLMGRRWIGDTLAKRIGKIATGICAERGWITDRVPDARYGYVKSYPREAVEIAFKAVVNNLPLTPA